MSDAQSRSVESLAAARVARYEHRYTNHYGYEAWLVRGRRRVTLDLIEERQPRRVIEVGCGSDLLVHDALGATIGPVKRWVIVEPSERFARGATAGTANDRRVSVVRGFFEQVEDRVAAELGGAADLVIIDGLLHELPDPWQVLRAAESLLAPAGWIHASVPNARSLHRRVALGMGLIDELGSLSARNRSLEQARVYDRESLRELVEGLGLEVLRWGGHTIKPFTNEQMERIEPVVGREVCEGLLRLGAELPDLAAEIWIDARTSR